MLEGVVSIWRRAGSAPLLAHGPSLRVLRAQSQSTPGSFSLGRTSAARSDAKMLRRPSQKQAQLGCWEGSRHGSFSSWLNIVHLFSSSQDLRGLLGPILVPESGWRLLGSNLGPFSIHLPFPRSHEPFQSFATWALQGVRKRQQARPSGDFSVSLGGARVH